LSQVIDTNGNYMSISYTQDQGQVYPSHIDYTGNMNSGLKPSNRVMFNYDSSDRPDPQISYESKFAVTTAKRLASIKTYAYTKSPRDTLALEYRLEHEQSRDSWHSLLTKINIFGSDSDTRLPGYSFSYSQGSSGATIAGKQSIDIISPSNVSSSMPTQGHLVDVNGDNRDDLVVVHKFFVKVRYSLGDGSFSENEITTQLKSLHSNNIAFRSYLSDINGDALPDLIVCRKGISSNDRESDYADFYFSNGDGTFSYTKSSDDHSEYEYYFDKDSTKGDIGFIDFNKDGYSDIYRHYLSSPNEGSGYYISRSYIRYGDGQGNFGPSVKTNGLPSSIFGKGIFRYFADVNGDGYPDVIDFCENRKNYWEGTREFTTYLSNGNGQFSKVGVKIFEEPAGCKIFDQWQFCSISFKDVNNDHRADLILSISMKSPNNPKNKIYTYISDGMGKYYIHDTRKKNFDQDSISSQSAKARTNGIDLTGHMADLNGDGISEFCTITEAATITESLESGSITYSFKGSVITNLSKGDAPFDLMTEAISPSGSKLTYTYRRSSEVTNHYFLPFIVYTVSSVTTDDGVRSETSKSDFEH
ncbi:MAG: hypothetical protein GY874_10290, partial [Desulfobacteraceae bacterium]|nr:hypothetical protein [Desulfobacteraceae bacterium]